MVSFRRTRLLYYTNRLNNLADQFAFEVGYALVESEVLQEAVFDVGSTQAVGKEENGLSSLFFGRRVVQERAIQAVSLSSSTLAHQHFALEDSLLHGALALGSSSIVANLRFLAFHL
jgi:hypothetical protein